MVATIAGLGDEPTFEDLIGHAQFLVTSGRIPTPSDWVDELVARVDSDKNEAFAEGFF